MNKVGLKGQRLSPGVVRTPESPDSLNVPTEGAVSAMRITKLVVLSVFVFIAFVFTTVTHASAFAKVDVKYFKTPLLFEPNEGQSAPGVDFVAHGKGYVLHLNANEAVFALRRERLSMRLVGSNVAAQPSALEPL